MSATPPFPLNAFASLADGQPIAAIRGVLVKLYDQKTGTSGAGAWALQNGEVEADGVTVPITFKDRDPIDKSWKGRTIFIEASNVKSMAGIYAWDDKRNDTVVRKIKVTPSATLSLMGGDSPAAQPPQQGQTSIPQQQPDPRQQEKPADLQGAPDQQQKPTGTTNNAPPSDRSKEDKEFQEARKTVNQIANLHLLCMLAVERYEADAYKELTGRDMSEGQRQAAVASIFIKADREGLVRYMPITDASKDARFAGKKH